MDEEQAARVLSCINGCWPEFPFTMQDLIGKKPMSADKFKELLILFLRGLLGGDYQLPGINMGEISRNPEMFYHMEGTFSLFREINSILDGIGCQKMYPIDLIRPNSTTVRDVLLALTNFIAYVESEDDRKAEIEEEIVKEKKSASQNEKKLEDEERLLGTARQKAEEEKLAEAELRKHLLEGKEKCMKAEGSVQKLESEVEELTKKISSAGARLEQANAALHQVEIEKEKAAEAVVPDPEALEAELLKSREDKESLLTDYQCLKERLPVLEQQLKDRQNRLQEHKDTIQRMNAVKARETKVKSEWSKAEIELRQLEEERLALENQFRKESSLTDSRKRMLDELHGKIAQYQAQLEKIRSDLKQRKNDEERRRQQMESRGLALESQIVKLKKDLEEGKKALEEGATVFHELERQHQQNAEQFRTRVEARLEQLHEELNAAFPDLDN